MIELPPEPPNEPFDPVELLKRINAAATRYDVPAGFDPRTADPADLDRLGLPQRPDQTSELFDFWQRMFSPPLSFETADFSYALPMPGNIQSAGAPFAGWRHESSLNWSGAFITPRDGRMFTQILGSWHVPAVSVPPGGAARGNYGSSTWIGLDGQRSYLNSTLPQIGTGQFLNPVGGPAGPQTTAWIQWWPLPPLTLPLSIIPGDEVMCWLIVTSLTDVLFLIKNHSIGPLYHWSLPAPVVVFPPYHPASIQAEVSGATAEWVMERPAIWPTTTLYDLPSYSPVTFHDCIAVSARTPVSPIRVDRLIGPTLIDMYKIEPNPTRTVTISVADRPATAPLLDVVTTTFV